MMTNNNKSEKKIYFFKRLRHELVCCQPWFHATEPVNQRTLSIPESFAPCSLTALVIKCASMGIAVGTFVYNFLESDNPEFQLAYLTIWGNLSCVLYLVMSTLNTILANRAGQGTSVNLRIRTTWILLEVAAHITGLACFGYYCFLFDLSTGPGYLEYALHGGILVLVLIDGMVINRIPFRFQHFFGIVMPIELLYVLWSYIHSLTGIGNPDTAHIQGSSGSVYEGVMDWSPEGLTRTLRLAVILVFVVGPVLFLFFWSLSNGLFCCRDSRRYVDSDYTVGEHETRPSMPDVEEGSFAVHEQVTEQTALDQAVGKDQLL